MNKIRIAVLFAFLSGKIFAQQNLCFVNPSMEGTSQPHVVPGPWQNCYGSPDTQPGQWGITQPASNGNTYVSFLQSGWSANGYTEGMSQLISPCMTAGVTYTFNIDLAHTNIYNTAGPNGCYSSLAVWGGNSPCAQTQLLWTSGSFTHTNWQTYTVTFTPTSNWCYVSFCPYYITACGNGSGYINCMLDNITCAVPQSTVTGTNCTCFGQCNGTSTATPSSGTPPYTYLWTPSNQTTSTITGLCPGTYSCTITDNTGQTTSGNYTVTQPTQIVANTTQTNILCNGQCTGVANVTANGGTGALTYLWSPGNQTTTSISNLCAGSYSVTVTDANNCTVQQVVTITQPPVVTASVTGTNVSCNGGNNGTATATPGGGTGTYTYNWAPSGGTNATANNLTAGNYTVTVTDGNGCTATATITITEPTALSIATSGFDATCNGACNGQGVCIPAGGTSPYSYAWSPSGGNNPSATGLCVGVYTILVTDANGCTISDTAIVNEPTVIAIATSSTTASCGQANGTASANVSGGVGPYTYAWAPSGGNSANATGLTAQTYTVTVTDFNGCTMTQTVVVPNAPGVTSSIVSSTNVTCNGACDGTVTANTNGGTAPYTYQWTNAATTLNISNVCAGSYTLLVTDANGCTSTSTVTITQPALLTSTASNAQTVCAGTSATVSNTAAGGTAPYTYLWSNAATTSSITVTPTATTTYTVVVTDANGCTATSNVTVTVNAIPVVTFTPITLSGCVPVCTQFVSTTPGQTYAWDFGDGNQGTGSAVNHCYTVPGQYSVTLIVTNNGCSGTLTIPNMVNAYPIPTAGFSMSNTSTTISDPTVTVTNNCVGCDSSSFDFGENNPAVIVLPNGSATYTYADTGTFTVMQIVWNAQGCYDTLYQTFIIRPEYTLFVPNSFTPNGDGLNDVFMPVGNYIDPNNYKLYVFDRWGNMIFNTDKWGTGWDGRANGGKDIAQEDVYVWKIITKDTTEGRKREYVGHVSLIK